MLPRSPLLAFAPASPPALYLTFDDGPHPDVTAELLDLMRDHGAKGSFFSIGQQIATQPDLARRIFAEGHLLANHSYYHKQFASLALKAQLEEVSQTDSLIENLTGHHNRFFRVPQGKWSAGLIWQLRRRGKVPVHWTYDSQDYRHAPAEEIIHSFADNPVTNGDMILFHDDDPTCVRVLESLLPQWAAQGFSFKRVDDA